jgi:hypothetical protein
VKETPLTPGWKGILDNIIRTVNNAVAHKIMAFQSQYAGKYLQKGSDAASFIGNYMRNL